jgi:hypothetical protein
MLVDGVTEKMLIQGLKRFARLQHLQSWEKNQVRPEVVLVNSHDKSSAGISWQVLGLDFKEARDWRALFEHL